MAECPNGHENPKGQQFCGQCGEPIAEPKPSATDDAVTAGAAAADEDQAPEAAGSRASGVTLSVPNWLKVRRNQLIAGGVATALVVVVVLILVLGGSSSNSTTSSANSGTSPPITGQLGAPTTAAPPSVPPLTTAGAITTVAEACSEVTQIANARTGDNTVPEETMSELDRAFAGVSDPELQGAMSGGPLSGVGTQLQSMFIWCLSNNNGQ
jgi:hypothetical protein